MENTKTAFFLDIHHFLDIHTPPSLKLLQSSLVSTLISSKAPRTIISYTSAFRDFIQFAKIHKIPYLPASPIHISLYLERKKSLGYKPSSLSNFLSSISWMHRITGHPSPSDSAICKAVIEGTKRTAPSPQCHTVPATRQSLLSLHHAVVASGKLPDYRTFLICLFSYAGCLRFDEVSLLCFQDISIHSQGLSIYLKHSKTDQHKKGHLLQLSDSKSPLSPKSCFQFYCSKLSKCQQKPTNFVFTNCRSKAPVSRSNSVRILRRLLATSNVHNGQKFTMHSFRIGCATALVEQGIDSANIREHGRWRSNSSFDRYLRPSVNHKLKISRALGL